MPQRIFYIEVGEYMGGDTSKASAIRTAVAIDLPSDARITMEEVMLEMLKKRIQQPQYIRNLPE